MVIAGALALLAGCGGGGTGTGGGGGTGGNGGAGTGGAGTGGTGTGGSAACPAIGTGKGVPHVIIILQENHTFDNYFGKWCTAPTGSNPTCNDGPSCCEAAPAMEPSGASPVVLDDTSNATYDPNHHQDCELAEINGGKMDQFVTGAGDGCSDPRNFAIAAPEVVATYHGYATQYAMSDRYFQSIAGASASNNMYFAVAKKVFIDNEFKPDSIGKECSIVAQTNEYTGQTIADLLIAAGKKVRFYAEGYGAAVAKSPGCPNAPAECGFHLPVYPCIYDPSDIPFLYYQQFADAEANIMSDYSELAKALTDNTLPDVSFVKMIGYRTEHPGAAIKISDGIEAVSELVDSVGKSCYKDSTLILLAWDEGGGYFDHVSPPPTSTVDNEPYGTRVPFIAIGRYAKKGFVSHVEMEHSSVVKFLEYNYLGGQTGQLGARDAQVNNIGSLIDPAVYGETIPD